MKLEHDEHFTPAHTRQWINSKEKLNIEECTIILNIILDYLNPHTPVAQKI